jgi:hypothetical protein
MGLGRRRCSSWRGGRPPRCRRGRRPRGGRRSGRPSRIARRRASPTRGRRGHRRRRRRRSAGRARVGVGAPVAVRARPASDGGGRSRRLRPCIRRLERLRSAARPAPGEADGRAWLRLRRVLRLASCRTPIGMKAAVFTAVRVGAGGWRSHEVRRRLWRGPLERISLLHLLGSDQMRIRCPGARRKRALAICCGNWPI